MVGFRSKNFYITKYGEDYGNAKYNKCVEYRAKRIARKDANRQVIICDYEQALRDGRAIKCRECGIIATRLQWTHFKYKCSDGMSSSKYKQKYPDAPLVCLALRNLQGITLDNMIKLYGDVEGRARFDSYRTKQAETNTFEYKSKKYGMTREDFADYNSLRSVTLENFVKRHGQKDGEKRWLEYIERQRYTTSLDHFVEAYGDKIGLERYENFVKGRNLKGESLVEKFVYDNLREIEGLSELQFQYIIPLVSGAFDFGMDGIVIEFYGRYWHADPCYYEGSWVHGHKKQTAAEIWARDRRKISAAVEKGYRAYVIWEDDFNKDIANCIENIVTWLNGTDQTGSSRPNQKN